MCLTVKSPEWEFSLNDKALDIGKTYQLPNQCIIGMASKNAPDLHLILDVSWRFLLLDD